MAVDHLSSASSPSGSRRSRGRPRAWFIVAMLCTFLLLNFADKGIVGLAGVEMMRDLGIDAGQFGLVQSAFFWLYAVGAIAGGYLVGKVPARWLLGGVALIWALSLLPMVWSTSFAVLLVTRILLGFAEGPAAAMAFSVTHSWFPAEKRALPTSIVAAGTSIGPPVAAPVITAIILNFSWHAAFAIAGVVGLVWVLVWLIVGRDGPESVGDDGAAPTRLPEHVPYRRLLTSGTFIGIALLFIATFCTAAVKISWLPLALRQGAGYDATTTGWIIAVTYLCGAALMVVSGAVSRAMTKRGASIRASRGLLSCALVAAGGVATAAWMVLDSGPLQVALLAIGVSLTVGAQGVSWTLISDVVPPRQRGTAMSVLTAVYSLGGIVAPLMLGGLVGGAETPLAGYQVGFAILGLILVVTAVTAAWAIRPERNVAAFLTAAGQGAAR